MSKKTQGPEEKVNLLKQDLDLATIMALFKRKKNHVEEEDVDENAGADFVPDLPEVNVLPSGVKEVYAAEDLLKKFMYGGAAAIGFFALLWGAGFGLEQMNEARIAEVNEQAMQYQSEATMLQPYAGYKDLIDTKRNELSTAMNGDVNPGSISSSFKDIAQSAGYTVTSVNVTLNSEGGGSCVNPDPFQPAQGIGCLTFDLEGSGSMNRLFDGLQDTERGFVNPYIPSALGATGDSEPVITGSVSFNEVFYTGMYDSLSLPVDSIISGVSTNEEVLEAPVEEGQ